MNKAALIARRVLNPVIGPVVISDRFFERLLSFLATAPNGPQRHTVERFLDSPMRSDQAAFCAALAMLTDSQLRAIEAANLDAMSDDEYRQMLNSIYTGAIAL